MDTHPQFVSPETSYPPNNREKRPLLAGNCKQALRGALTAGREKEAESLQLRLLWNLNSTSNSPVAPRRLSCQISANQREAETSANANKIWKASAKGNDVITVSSANQQFA